MVRFYTFIVCLVLLLGMSRCVPAWADQPSASHGYDAATHYDDSLDSDCQSTPPGCAYVAQEHKTDCAHSESRAKALGDTQDTHKPGGSTWGYPQTRTHLAQLNAV